MYQDFAAAYAKDRAASLTRAGQPRKRAAGGGTPFSQDGRTRLLMTLVFLRVYPTYEVLATLEAHTVFVCECPAEDLRKLRSAQRLDPNCVDELRGRRSPRQQVLTKASQPGWRAASFLATLHLVTAFLGLGRDAASNARYET